MLPVMKAPADHEDDEKNIFRVRSANKRQGKGLNRREKTDRMKSVVATAAALGMALLFCTQGVRAGNLASDNGSLYQNPWDPVHPQNQPATGFAPWVFDQFNTPTSPFFIDTTRGAWGINVPADHNGSAGYDAAWRGFTGDGTLDPGQTFSTTVLFTPPGAHTATETATEGVDFFAQDPAVPSHYDNFGHQVLGIYFGPVNPSGPTFNLAVHTTLSDENPKVFATIPLPFTGTASSPQAVNISFTQLAQGNWILKMVSGTTTVTLTSQKYGATWNTAQGLDGVRYFTSQGGTNPGGPLEWENTSVRPASPATKDFNGDGNADLVWENGSTGQRAIWFLKNGVFSSSILLPTVPVQWHIVGVGDFKGDGNADLVWENSSTVQRAIWFMKNGVLTSSIFLPKIPVQWHIAGAGDFNGDGNADLVWENTSTGQRAIWFMKNGVLTSTTTLPTVSIEWHIVGVGDFSGDGNADLVWENSSTGQRAIWFMKNGLLSSTTALPTVPVQWHIAGAGDFSGDGNAGLVWQNTATGQRAIWFMKNGVLTNSINLPMVPLTWSIEDH
jgi:FG-GAP-like repeat